jgi:hypothetical protein
MALSARDTAAVVGVSAAVGFLGGLLSVPFSFSVLGARLQKRTPITFSTNHAVDTVVARRFVLIDSEGRTRATLENTDEGAELELTSPRTKTVARLDVTDSAPIEALQRPKGKSTTSDWAEFLGKGSAELWLYVPGGKQLTDTTAILSADSQGEAGYELDGGNTGEMSARVYELGTKLELFAPASATPYEGAHLTVHGEKSWVTLAGDSLSIADDKGSPRATVGTTGLGTKATGATETTAPSSLTLFDRRGKVISSGRRPNIGVHIGP